MAVSDKIIQINYELRNLGDEFTDAELLAYYNKANEILYRTLINMESDWVRTGSDSFTTVEGTQYYNLATDEDIEDIWLLHRVWVSEYEPMDVCAEADLYDAINEEEAGNTGHRCIPTEYCMLGNVLWFKESPDDAYTVHIKYYPSYTDLESTDDMPYNGMFDMALSQAVIFIAKNRNEMGVNIEAQLTSIFEKTALDLARRRRKAPKQFTPRMS